MRFKKKKTLVERGTEHLEAEETMITCEKGTLFARICNDLTTLTYPVHFC